LLRVGLQPQTVFVNVSYGAVKSECGVLKNKLQHVEEREREREMGFGLGFGFGGNGDDRLFFFF
jgi:hypothetical protein